MFPPRPLTGQVGTLSGHTDTVLHMLVVDDSDMVFTASLDASIRAWDISVAARSK